MLGKIYQHVEDMSAWIKDIPNFLAKYVNEYNAYIFLH